MGVIDEERELWRVKDVTCVMVSCCSGAELQLRRSGDVILREGNANRALHIVHNGKIRVSGNVDGHEVPLCDLLEGQTFGELPSEVKQRISHRARALARSGRYPAPASDRAYPWPPV